MGCTLSPVMPAISDSARLRAVFTNGALSTFGSLEAFLDANPTSHAGAQTPPFLVLIAEAEQVNPPILERARTFEARMTAVGRPVEVDVLPDRRHYTALTSMANATDPTLKLLLDFIRRSTTGQ
jgi:acetyl esterase/lipase